MTARGHAAREDGEATRGGFKRLGPRGWEMLG